MIEFDVNSLVGLHLNVATIKILDRNMKVRAANENEETVFIMDHDLNRVNLFYSKNGIITSAYIG